MPMLDPTPAHKTRTGEVMHTVNPTRVFTHRADPEGQSELHTAQLQPDGAVHFFVGSYEGRGRELSYEEVPDYVKASLEKHPLVIPEAGEPGQVLETCVVCGELKPSGVMKSHLIDHLLAGQVPEGVSAEGLRDTELKKVRTNSGKSKE